MEMIKIAQQRASQKYETEVQIAHTKAAMTESTSFLNELPEYPTTEQIIEEARKLKEFVDGR